MTESKVTDDLAAREVLADYYRSCDNNDMADEIVRDDWRRMSSEGETKLVEAISRGLAALPLLSQPVSGERPEFVGIARRKLDDLVARGWSINGYAIEKDGKHGFVTTGAFVGWWLPEDYPNHTSDQSPPSGERGDKL